MEKGISNKVKKRLKVDSWLCLGCGLCAMNCSQGAISLFLRKSYIDQGKCISCNRCIRICP